MENRKKIAITLAILALAPVLSFAVDADRASVAAEPVPARKALVIGNGAYAATPLKNPVNDARDVANALRNLGFDVTVFLDVRGEAMMAGIRSFTESLTPGDSALFFFSGHGFQLRGTNYLIPVDNDIASVEEVAYKAPSVDYILSRLEEAKTSTNVIILDACRNNPFPGSDRALWRGLANVDYPVSDTIIVYSTAPGSVAADGAGRNGVFTKSLISRMADGGKDIESVLRLVRDDVIKETAGIQIPWSNSSLRGPGFFFAGNAPSTDARRAADATPGAAGATGAAGESGAAGAGTSAGTDEQAPPDMAFVKGGTFFMGYDAADEDEKPVHGVALGDYYIAQYETTYEEYDEFCAATGRERVKDSGNGRSQRPVAFVSWFDALEYCNWRSRREQLPPAYDISCDAEGKPVSASMIAGSTGYRIPTEAEWEYAARGGPAASAFRYAGGDSLGPIAVCKDNSLGATWTGGTKKPNALNAYDMSGNVWEWCYDWYGPYGAEPGSARGDIPVANPTGPATGKMRILRGGGYNTATTAYYSVSNRGTSAPVRVGSDIGFRVVRSAR